MKNIFLSAFIFLLIVNFSNAQTTQLVPSSCGVTLNNLQDDLFVTVVSGATNYQYHITNAATGFDKYWNRGSSSNIFRLGWINGISYNTTYQVEVRPYVNGSWGNWGAVCDVTSPSNIPTTKLSVSSCNITLNQLSDILYSDIVSGATDYEYSITHSSGFSKIYRRGSSSNAFSMSWIGGIQYGVTYDIQVRASINGSWGNYGVTCQVTTPAAIPLTQLDASSCGKTLSSISELVYCNIISGATNYQYKITNTSLGFNTTYLRNSSSNAFSLSWVNGISYGYTYDIEVRSYVNGNWSAYGAVCQLTVPGIPTTQLNNAACGATLTAHDQIVYAEPVTGATNYEYKIMNDSLNFNVSYFRNSGSNVFSLNWVPGIVHGFTYDIQVRAYVNNTWGSFGNICQLTAIPKIKMNPSFCGIQLNEITDVILAPIVPYATKYQYNVYNDSIGINLTSIRDKAFTCCPSAFALNMMNGLRFEKTYKIRVRAYINGTWGEYGETCDITTPVFPHTSFLPQYCDITLNNSLDDLYVYWFYNVTNYEYSITDPVTNWNTTYYRGSGSNVFKLGWVNGIMPSTTYEISVRAFANGDWGPEGTICTITTPSSLRQASFNNDINSSDIEVYPNPATSKNSLQIKFKGEILNTKYTTVQIIGMQGNVILTEEFLNNDSGEYKLPGHLQLSPGMYTIKVVQENRTYYKKFTIL